MGGILHTKERQMPLKQMIFCLKKNYQMSFFQLLGMAEYPRMHNAMLFETKLNEMEFQ